MRSLPIFSLLATLVAAGPQDASTHHNSHRAINPTSSGQIGVNPVSEYVMTTTYAPGLKNPSVTITVGSRPTIMHIPWGIAPQPNGDVAFPVTPQGKEYLQDIFDEVTASCSLKAKNKKRQPGGACAPADALEEFQRIGSSGGRLDFDIPIDFTIPTVTAGDVSVVLQSTPAAVVIAFLAYLMAPDGKVNDKKAPLVEHSDIHTPTKASTTDESVPTTTWYDMHDSIETAGNAVYMSMAQKILAEIKSDWSADGELWGDSPTPAPLPNPSCGPKLQNMETSVFKKLGVSFCDNIDLSKETKKELTNKDAHTTSFEGFKFDLNWEPKNQKCENVKCEAIFNSFANSCCYDSHSMNSIGSMDLDCGKASYKIIPPGESSPSDQNKLVCSSDKQTFLVTGTGAAGYSSINVSQGEKAIAEFCKSTREINPKSEDTSHGFAIGSTGNGAYYAEYSLGGFNRVAVQVGWPKDQTGCADKKTFKLADMDGCEGVLKTALNGCDTDSVDVKFGGTVIQKRPDVGCVNFDFGGIFTYSTWDGSI